VSVAAPRQRGIRADRASSWLGRRVLLILRVSPRRVPNVRTVAAALGGCSAEVRYEICINSMFLGKLAEEFRNSPA
jgi:hypothetical protein